jgi:Domain of unknown function (DUF5004)
MKTNKFYIQVSILLVIVLVACQPEDDFPALENPLALKTTLLNGTWTASKVRQYDKEAIDNGFPDDIQARDITALFPFTEYKITFNLDASGRPGTFVVVPGASPNFLSLNQGTWALDDYVFATRINLTNVTDVNSSTFRITVLEPAKILLQIVRNDAGDNTEYSYYEYEFVK